MARDPRWPYDPPRGLILRFVRAAMNAAALVLQLPGVLLERGRGGRRG